MTPSRKNSPARLTSNIAYSVFIFLLLMAQVYGQEEEKIALAFPFKELPADLLPVCCLGLFAQAGAKATLSYPRFEYDFCKTISPQLDALPLACKDLKDLFGPFSHTALHIIAQKYTIPTVHAAKLTRCKPYYECACKLFAIVKNERLSNQQTVDQIEQLKNIYGIYFDINCSRYATSTQYHKDGQSFILPSVETPLWHIAELERLPLLEYFFKNGANFYLGYQYNIHDKSYNSPYITKQNLLSYKLWNQEHPFIEKILTYIQPVPRESFKCMFNNMKTTELSIYKLNMIYALIKKGGAQLSDINWKKISYKDAIETYLKNCSLIAADATLPEYRPQRKMWLHNLFKKSPAQPFTQEDGLLWIDTIVNNGYDVNAVDLDGNSLLLLVLDSGYYCIPNIAASTLLDHLIEQSNINVQNFARETSLHRAISLSSLHVNKYTIINQLLDAKADPTITDAEGNSALDKACGCSVFSLNIIKRLVQAGCFPNQKNIQREIDLLKYQHSLNTHRLLYLLQHYQQISSLSPKVPKNFMELIDKFFSQTVPCLGLKNDPEEIAQHKANFLAIWDLLKEKGYKVEAQHFDLCRLVSLNYEIYKNSHAYDAHSPEPSFAYLILKKTFELVEWPTKKIVCTNPFPFIIFDSDLSWETSTKLLLQHYYTW